RRRHTRWPRDWSSDVCSSDLFRQNRIVAVYEPADPLLNSYNLNLLFESPTKVCVEVLGPGFDASDLQRGDLSPHQVFSILLSQRSEERRVGKECRSRLSRYH